MSTSNHWWSQNMPAMVFVVFFLAAFAAFRRSVSGASLSDHLTELSGSSKRDIGVGLSFYSKDNIFCVFHLFCGRLLAHSWLLSRHHKIMEMIVRKGLSSCPERMDDFT